MKCPRCSNEMVNDTGLIYCRKCNYFWEDYKIDLMS